MKQNTPFGYMDASLPLFKVLSTLGKTGVDWPRERALKTNTLTRLATAFK